MPNAADTMPAFVAETLAEHYDEATCAHIAQGFGDARDRPVTLRANTLATDADAVGAALAQAGIEFSHPAWYPDAFVLAETSERAVWDLELYRTGSVYLQSLSSMLPPLVLGPRAGADVLDMCAAPGGKTSQLAALAGGAAHLTACEMSAPRAEKLAYNLRKLGAENVQVMRCDARRLDEFFRFDQVLVDAPCTGTGTLRANDPKAARRITPALLAKTVRSQRALLDRGLTVLKQGGTLVYSTCSILPEENECIVAEALRRHKDCELVPIALDAADGDHAADGEPREPQPIMLAAGAEGPFALPLLPCGLAGALLVAPTRAFEGFFVAALHKKAGTRR